MFHRISRLSISIKFLLVVIFSIIAVITALTFLLIQREILLIQTDHEKDAGIITSAIGKALMDNMLAGFPEGTKRLIRELSSIEGVSELSVIKPDGSYAFGLSGPRLSLNPAMMDTLKHGKEITFTKDGARYFMKPLINEKSCRPCHMDGEAIRGIIVCKMSSEAIEHRTSDLIKRMTAFGVVSVILLSGILTLFSRKMLLSPIKGLTDTARQITGGNFVLFRPRGSKCSEVMGCNKNGCPSYSDETTPCWLKSGTLCACGVPGRHSLKPDDCHDCKVYKSLKGDEIVELQDNFNVMSLSLGSHEEDTRRHIMEAEALNRELARSNTKLSTLLEASRLTTSTLELEETLSTSMKIILNVTQLKVGIVLLMEEDLTGRCHEYFRCEAYNCPAYKSEVNCWRLAGTMCHSEAFDDHSSLVPQKYRSKRKTHTYCTPVMNFEEKTSACSNCEFFANIILIPRMTSGYKNGHIGERRKVDSDTLKKALLKGTMLINYSRENPFNIPMETSVEIAMPLKIKDQIIGVLYLASDMVRDYGKDEMEFFQFLSEVITSGVLNSRLYEDMENSYFQTVMSLSNAVEAKDPYTRGHSERVADLSMKIAEVLNLTRQEKEHLRFAAILHDVGKIGISLKLLRKDHALDEKERKEMRSHPDSGVQILQPVHFLKPVLPAIRHHHEKYDGSGYPLGLKGKEIPLKARILGVADAWDAMLSNRPYRDALAAELAQEELKKHAGTQFDPEIVEAFLKAIEKYGGQDSSSQTTH